MNKIIIIICFLIGNFLSCNSQKTKKQMPIDELKTKCCKECLDAFNQSPVAVGAQGAICGKFPTGKPICDECYKYFNENPATVYDCEQYLNSLNNK